MPVTADIFFFAACADTLPQQQQWRGFKTKHSKQSTGVGMKKSGADESMKALKLSVSERFSLLYADTCKHLLFIKYVILLTVLLCVGLSHIA